METSWAPAHLAHRQGRGLVSEAVGLSGFSLTPGWPPKAPQPTGPGIQTLLELHLAWRVWAAREGLGKPKKAVSVQETGRVKVSGP